MVFKTVPGRGYDRLVSSAEEKSIMQWERDAIAASEQIRFPLRTKARAQKQVEQLAKNIWREVRGDETLSAQDLNMFVYLAQDTQLFWLQKSERVIGPSLDRTPHRLIINKRKCDEFLANALKVVGKEDSAAMIKESLSPRPALFIRSEELESALTDKYQAEDKAAYINTKVLVSDAHDKNIMRVNMVSKPKLDDREKHYVFLMDNSRSMRRIEGSQQKTRMNYAIEALKGRLQQVKEEKGTALVSVVMFSGSTKTKVLLNSKPIHEIEIEDAGRLIAGQGHERGTMLLKGLCEVFNSVGINSNQSVQLIVITDGEPGLENLRLSQYPGAFQQKIVPLIEGSCGKENLQLVYFRTNFKKTLNETFANSLTNLGNDFSQVQQVKSAAMLEEQIKAINPLPKTVTVKRRFLISYTQDDGTVMLIPVADCGGTIANSFIGVPKSLTGDDVSYLSTEQDEMDEKQLATTN